MADEPIVDRRLPLWRGLHSRWHEPDRSATGKEARARDQHGAVLPWTGSSLGPKRKEDRRMSAIPVLLYHAVTEDPPADQVPFTVSPADFAEHAGAVAASGRVPLTISELAAALRAERPLPERAVAVTFDDGFIDTPSTVTLLAERDISSTVFIATARIGRELPTQSLRELLGVPGVELGAHTVSHPYLDELPLAGARREVVDSKRQLEESTERDVHSFAYPHGAYETRVRETVAAAGFSAGAAVKNALSHRADDPLAIARWTVRADTAITEIEKILDGRGAPLAWTRERHRTRAYRSARRLRRRLRLTADSQ